MRVCLNPCRPLDRRIIISRPQWVHSFRPALIGASRPVVRAPASHFRQGSHFNPLPAIYILRACQAEFYLSRPVSLFPDSSRAVHHSLLSCKFGKRRLGSKDSPAGGVLIGPIYRLPRLRAPRTVNNNRQPAKPLSSSIGDFLMSLPFSQPIDRPTNDDDAPDDA